MLKSIPQFTILDLLDSIDASISDFAWVSMGLPVPNCNCGNVEKWPPWIFIKIYIDYPNKALASLFGNVVVQYSTQTQILITYLTSSTYHHKPMVVMPGIFEFFTSFHRQTFSMVEPADAPVCCQSGISSNILSLTYLSTLTAVH